MGDIYRAYLELNKMYDLGLSAEQILRAEQNVKAGIARSNPDPTLQRLSADPEKLATKYELNVRIAPRRKELTREQLAELAKKEAGEI